MYTYYNIDIKTKKETEKEINQECIEIYSKKLELNSMILGEIKKTNKKFILNAKSENRSETFGNMASFIDPLLKLLWEKPKIVSELLLNSNSKDVKENLAPFIVNNFYENILSSFYIDDNLMYLITLLIQKDINSLNDVNQPEKFLEETICGIILEELRNKNDIQTFFKIIITKIVQQLELSFSNQEIIFNINELEHKILKNRNDNLNNKKKGIKAKEAYKKTIEVEWENEEEAEKASKAKKMNIFNSKYMPDLIKDEIISKKNEEKNNNVKDYLDLQINYCEKIKNDNVFTNMIFLSDLFKSENPEELFIYYQIFFFKAIALIKKLYSTFLNNLYLIPYSMKCICKIILLLLKKKFPDINIIQQNAFIAKFFIDKLLIPIIKNPAINALIDSYIISETTMNNLSKISEILKKFASGKLYMNTVKSEMDLTPFNRFFIEQMPKTISLFESLTKVQLPSFLEKYINNELPENYEFDYFMENPDEIIYHRSICYNFDNIFIIVNNLHSLKNKILLSDNLLKTIEQFNLSKLNDYKKADENKYIIIEPKPKKKEKLPIKNYFLITELVPNEKFSKLFKIDRKHHNYYYINELKKTDNEEQISQNLIIKVKNLLCSLLYNYETLIIKEFEDGTTENIFKILGELRKFMKSINKVIDNSIPSIWYVDSLMNYLQKLPENYKKNNFELLYKEIEKEVNNSIKECDFEEMSCFIDKMKFAKRGKNYYEHAISIITEIFINQKVQLIIEKEKISVDISFKCSKNSNEKSLNIIPTEFNKHLSILDGMFEESKKKPKTCETIKAFTVFFPNLVMFQNQENKFQILKELDIPKKLDEYFKIIRNKLKKSENILNLQNFDKIMNKIYDFVMEKLYSKINLSRPSNKDNIILDKCVELSWTEPKHYMHSNINYNYDNFLPDVVNYFKLIDSEKSPRKKFIYLNLIFKCIDDVCKFNGGFESKGVDNLLPILNYALVKAQPSHIDSNCSYMSLFLGNKKGGSDDSLLSQLIAIGEFVYTITFDKLNGVTKNEFDDKCEECHLSRTGSGSSDWISSN